MTKGVDKKLTFRATWMVVGFLIGLLIAMSFWFIKLESNTGPVGKGVLIGRPIAMIVCFCGLWMAIRTKIIFKSDRLIISYPEKMIFFKPIEILYTDIIKIQIQDNVVLKVKGKGIFISVRGKQELYLSTVSFTRKKQLHAAFEDLSAKAEAQNQEKVGPSSSSV